MMNKKSDRRLSMFLCACVLHLLAGSIFASDKILDASQIDKEPASLTEYFAVLEDPTTTLTLDEIKTPAMASRFKQVQAPARSLNYGVTRSAYWLKFRLRNQADHPILRMLEISHPMHRSIRFYSPSSNGTLGSVSTGISLPFANRPYPNRFFVFPIRLPANTDQEYYLRIQSVAPMIIPVKLWETQAFHAYERNDYLGQAWYFGTAMTMILFNLLLFLAMRDKSYLYYIGFVTLIALSLAAENGLADEFLWQDSPQWSEMSPMIGFTLSLAVGILFMRRMIHSVTLVPRLDRLLQWVSGLLLVIPLTFVASLQNFLVPGIIACFVGIILVVGTLLRCAYLRQRAAYFFLAAFAAIVVGAAVHTLRALGVLPSNIITSNALQISSALEMILLAFALADRIIQILHEKEIAQQILVEHLQSAGRLLEHRVAERTTELNATVSTLGSTLQDLRATQTQLIQSEKEANQSLATIQSILDASPVGICMMDDQLRYVQVNKHYERMSGYSVDELLGHTAQRFFPSKEAFKAFNKRAIPPVVAGKTYNEELLLKSRNGTDFWIHVYIRAVDLTDIRHGTLFAVEDITNRKRAEQEITDALVKIQSILDTAPVGIALLDAQFRHTQVNKSYVRISGYSAKEWLGQTHEMAFLSTEVFNQYVDNATSALLAGETFFRKELPMRHRDGVLRWINAQVNAIDPKDFNRGFVAVCEDISERKKSEQEIKESHAKLESTLYDLRTTQTQLIQSEKMASLGQLVANVAHEINTPIGAIKSSGENITDALGASLENLPKALQLLNDADQRLFLHLIRPITGPAPLRTTREERIIKQNIAKQLTDASIPNVNNYSNLLVQLRVESDLHDYLPLLRHPQCAFILETASSLSSIVHSANNINTAVARVGKIVFALKAFSTIGTNSQMTYSALCDGMETVLAIYYNQIKQGTELVRHYEDLPPILCLADELNHVWTNLVHNALQAMGHKGTLTIGIRREEDNAVVSVGDTGCGIPEAIRGRIFEPFFSTKPIGEGSGLGLDIARKIVDKHKGRIEVHSEVGVGTTFSVHLPLNHAECQIDIKQHRM